MTSIARERRGGMRMRMVRSTYRSRDRARLAVVLLAPALLLTVMRSPAEAVAIALTRTVGSNATKTTGTTLAVTVPASGVALGHRLIISFAMDPAAGAVTAADTKGNVYSVDADIS